MSETTLRLLRGLNTMHTVFFRFTGMLISDVAFSSIANSVCIPCRDGVNKIGRFLFSMLFKKCEIGNERRSITLRNH